MKKFKFGDPTRLSHGTEVYVHIPSFSTPVHCVVVGKSTADVTNGYIVKCLDGKLPSETYLYDTFAVPINLISIEE